MSDPIDPQEIAIAELRAQMVPTPDDIVDMVGTVTQVYYLQMLAYSVMTQLVAKAEVEGESDDDADQVTVKVLEAISTACGNLTAACVYMGILPEEAVQG